MKKTGSETPSDEPDTSKAAAPAEPVERARLQADVAKQRVRIAKEELKRARKRLKEAKREARRARKQAASARKVWKQELRASKDAGANGQTQPAAGGKDSRAKKKEKLKKAKPAKKAARAAAPGKSRRPAPKRTTRGAPGATATPSRTNPVRPESQPARTSPKRTSNARSVKRTDAKSRQPQQKQLAPVPTPRADREAEGSASVVPAQAAKPDELATTDSAATNGAAVGHGT